MTIYWCEFPDKCNWNNLSKWLEELNKNITIYVACTSRKDYENKRTKINNITKRIDVNAWPTLTKKEGYWFSGFSSIESINKLEQYKGLKIKIDIEPPIPEKYNLLSSFSWLFLNLIRKPKNSKYLQTKIKELSKNTEIILSTFPLLRFILKSWGWIEIKSIKYNFMYYSTFFPRILLPFYNFYYKIYFLKNIKYNYLAIGLIGTGVFKSEPIYKNIKEMKRDMKFLKNNELIFFNIEAISNRGKEWLKLSLENNINH